MLLGKHIISENVISDFIDSVLFGLSANETFHVWNQCLILSPSLCQRFLEDWKKQQCYYTADKAQVYLYNNKYD